MDTRRYRVTQSVSWQGKWVVQYHDPQSKLYFDVGDAHDTQAEAEAKLRRIQDEEE